MAKLTKAQIIETVDAIGSLRAALAPDLKRLKKLEESIKELGVGSYEGAMFRGTVSAYDRDVLDMDAVRAKLSAQFLNAHTTTTPVVKLNVVAKLKEAA